MSDADFAIQLESIDKTYRLHNSQRDQLVDVLGLRRLGFRTRSPAREFVALSGISLAVRRGQRIGIIGRNGAGKTTLLKLICGTISPSAGTVQVQGRVQALLSTGIGFHPEYTGRENVKAALQYNGLPRAEYEQALAEVVEFCELGEFIDQPFKTYSLGMQARLMFAAATAIRPDILIVDEVLGAGDAYFVAKSKRRVERLVRSGCTMLLVSHSMQQVLELCEEVLWLDGGRLRMRGEAFAVVKAYEEYMHGKSETLILPPPVVQPGAGEPAAAAEARAAAAAVAAQARLRFERPAGLRLQAPEFMPHQVDHHLPEVRPEGFRFTARGGLSRWDSSLGLKFSGFSIVTERGESDELISLRPAKFVCAVTGEVADRYSCRLGMVIFDHLGTCVARIIGAVEEFDVAVGGVRYLELALNPCQIGPGEYVVSLSLHGGGPAEMLGAAVRYDLLNRSFRFAVEMPESLVGLAAGFLHSAECASYE